MSSFSIIINKNRRLPEDYIPENLLEAPIPFSAPPDDPKRLMQKDASYAAKALFKRANDSGMNLYGISGYRSYKRQEELYLAALKKANLTTASAPDDLAKLLVAPPGASEHQSGLALDVSCPEIDMELTEAFADTKEGEWLKAYAPLYGFILRYPKGKESITGYAYEPWHIRYVSKSLALYLSLTGLTLEEYDLI